MKTEDSEAPVSGSKKRSAKWSMSEGAKKKIKVDAGARDATPLERTVSPLPSDKNNLYSPLPFSAPTSALPPITTPSSSGVVPRPSTPASEPLPSPVPLSLSVPPSSSVTPSVPASPLTTPTSSPPPVSTLPVAAGLPLYSTVAPLIPEPQPHSASALSTSPVDEPTTEGNSKDSEANKKVKQGPVHVIANPA
ncbi:hypothetical protein PAXRUDRAFT_16824 [Paxillus rubicundulus Ve08.2h10]|uniref:Uncharacterized protein n=1 Tax=Paxillus rubicundulus Ve08.2h10 TaxID=930991 RepID=A0A0D0DK27_9AGAM|nr:hypothetical protein PAXRUDRAFT_16824 [Paxillus rubicundulus Ve08.2h10]